MNDNEMKDALRLLLKLWKEGGQDAVEAFLALGDNRAEKLLPSINELSAGFPVTINGDHFEMTGIDNWRIGTQTVEHIWTLSIDCDYLISFALDGSFERAEVILRDNHLVARIPIKDYVPCFEAYLKDKDK